MKTPRALLFAVLCGLLAAILTFLYWSERERKWQGKFGSVSVLVATRTIERYQTIEEGMLAVKSIPRDFVEPNAKTAEDVGSVVGLMADAMIAAGSQITLEKITAPGASRISSAVPKEMRACTLSVNEITGVAGLIRPGDSVDVLGTFKGVDEKTRVANRAEVLTLFQNMQVLSVGRNYLFETEPKGGKERGMFGGGATGFSNVTVLANPRQCMDLTLAQQVGEITLALRSYNDRFSAKPNPELKEVHSTTSSLTGIKGSIEISKRPRWLEIRGEQSMMVP
ncbi:MAG: Flp pilus assembly protein CpaB [Pseudomonadota bacterium]